MTNKPILKAISKEGTIFGGVSCYVLSDGSRVVTSNTMVSALSGGAGKRGELGRYIERLPNGSELLAVRANVEFSLPKGGKASGVNAQTVARILRLYVEAWGSNVLRKNQIPVAQRAATMLAQLGEIGIIALIDEATGHQKKRSDTDLNDRLMNMIRAELDDVDPVYKPLLVALSDLRCKTIAGETRYDGLGTPPPWAPTVANICVTAVWGEAGRKKLRELNPVPTWHRRDPQHLDEDGKKLLVRTLGIAEAYAHIAKNWDDWRKMMDGYFKGFPLQTWLF